VIVVGGLPVHHYRAEDAVAEAYAMVFLVDSGFAQQTDVAREFGKSVRPFGPSKSAMRTAGWLRSAERKGGVAADGVSLGNVCALSRR